MSFSEEPAVWIGGATAIVNAALVVAVSFGLPLTPQQKTAVDALITATATFLGAVLIRSQVTPANNAKTP